MQKRTKDDGSPRQMKDSTSSSRDTERRRKEAIAPVELESGKPDWKGGNKWLTLSITRRTFSESNIYRFIDKISINL
jgi:hypothetical protein